MKRNLKFTLQNVPSLHFWHSLLNRKKSQSVDPEEGSLVCKTVEGFRLLLSDLFDGFTYSLTLLLRSPLTGRMKKPEETFLRQRLLCCWLLGGIFLKQSCLHFCVLLKLVLHLVMLPECPWFLRMFWIPYSCLKQSSLVARLSWRDVSCYSWTWAENGGEGGHAQGFQWIPFPWKSLNSC